MTTFAQDTTLIANIAYLLKDSDGNLALRLHGPHHGHPERLQCYVISLKGQSLDRLAVALDELCAAEPTPDAVRDVELADGRFLLVALRDEVRIYDLLHHLGVRHVVTLIRDDAQLVADHLLERTARSIEAV